MTTSDTPEAAKPKLTRESYDENWNMKTDTPRTDAYQNAIERLKAELQDRIYLMRLTERAEKAEAEVKRITELTQDCLNVIRVYCPTYYQDAMERFNKTNK